MTDDLQKAEQVLTKQGVGVTDDPRPKRKDLLSTGSTLLNLACAGSPHGGFMRGKYYFLVGDSASGKTFLSMSCLAEATINPRFSEYRLIYDNTEDGCLIDVGAMFSPKVESRIEPPAIDKDGAPCYSTTVEEFYYHVDDAIKAGKPFVYVLDSMDALTSAAEVDKFDEQKDAFRKGKNAAGSYGDGKAKQNSSNLRRVVSSLRQSGSILIILAQTRDNLGFGFETKTRSGGRALKFYATVEVWTSVAGAIKRNVKGKDRQIGVNVLMQVKKNRITGQTPKVEVPIYPSVGIDDVGSCVDYLLDEGWWEKAGQSVDAKDMGLKAPKEKLIATIEATDRVRELRSIVGKCWRAIEEASAVNRKNRYA